MLFAKNVFRAAGVYGLLVTLPLYFFEEKIGADYPPAINHPEFYYSFVGVVVVFQLLFFVVASDPVRYRKVMIISILEKMSLLPTFFILYATDRLPQPWFPMVLDLVLGVLFFVSYQKTKE